MYQNNIARKNSSFIPTAINNSLPITNQFHKISNIAHHTYNSLLLKFQHLFYHSTKVVTLLILTLLLTFNSQPSCFAPALSTYLVTKCANQDQRGIKELKIKIKIFFFSLFF